MTINEPSCRWHRAHYGQEFLLPPELLAEDRSATDAVSRLFGIIRGCKHDGYLLEHHSIDVGNLCDRFARHLGLTTEEVETVATAGLLHDVGKVFTNLDVLTGTGRLTDDMVAEMKRHPADGAALIVHPELSAVSELVLRHHEWPCGAGYPNAIAGHEIPPLARVISVVDWYAACRERRTYRPELTHEKSMELTYIAAHEGKIDLLLTVLLDRSLARESWRPSSSDPERVIHAAS
jgi:HD-GYP domain-containing protein (c-di-GMP phosphodiesterase class II)